MAPAYVQGVMLLAAVRVKMFEDRDTEEGGFGICVRCAADLSINVPPTSWVSAGWSTGSSWCKATGGVGYAAQGQVCGITRGNDAKWGFLLERRGYALQWGLSVRVLPVLFRCGTWGAYCPGQCLGSLFLLSYSAPCLTS